MVKPIDGTCTNRPKLGLFVGQLVAFSCCTSENPLGMELCSDYGMGFDFCLEAQNL